MQLPFILLALFHLVPSSSLLRTSPRCFHTSQPNRDHSNIPRMVATVPSGVTSIGTGDDLSREAERVVSSERAKASGLRIVELYDTTLRDGTQMEGISASVNDKLKIANELHNFGISSRVAVLFSCWRSHLIKIPWIVHRYTPARTRFASRPSCETRQSPVSPQPLFQGWLEQKADSPDSLCWRVLSLLSCNSHPREVFLDNYQAP